MLPFVFDHQSRTHGHILPFHLLFPLHVNPLDGIDISGNRHETSTGRARESEPVHVYARNHARNQASSSHPFPGKPAKRSTPMLRDHLKR